MNITINTDEFREWIKQNSKYIPPFVIFEETLLKFISEKEKQESQNQSK